MQTLVGFAYPELQYVKIQKDSVGEGKESNLDGHQEEPDSPLAWGTSKISAAQDQQTSTSQTFSFITPNRLSKILFTQCR